MGKKPVVKTICWKKYDKDSYYSDNIRNSSGRPRFRISEVHGNVYRPYALILDDHGCMTATNLAGAQDYFEGYFLGEQHRKL